eukprot:11227523-Ditylum_brightwellii.AAC.1
MATASESANRACQQVVAGVVANGFPFDTIFWVVKVRVSKSTDARKSRGMESALRLVEAMVKPTLHRRKGACKVSVLDLQYSP